MKIFNKLDKQIFLVFAVLLLMYASRIYVTGRLSFGFIFWNLFLAYLPYLMSKTFPYFTRFRKWIQVFIAFTWMLLLPNSFYVFTDLAHLRPKSAVPIWLDVAFLYLSAFIGALLGIVSIMNAEIAFRKYHSAKKTTWMIIGVLLLCGFGVYLGRFDRWNSWDVLQIPHSLAWSVIQYIFNPIDNRIVWYRSLGMGLMFCAMYFLITKISFTKSENE